MVSDVNLHPYNKGKVHTTISQGEVVFEDGKLADVVKPGRGEFVRLPGGDMPIYDGVDKVVAAAKAALKKVDRGAGDEGEAGRTEL